VRLGLTVASKLWSWDSSCSGGDTGFYGSRPEGFGTTIEQWG
jgi:hypothetical protein